MGSLLSTARSPATEEHKRILDGDNSSQANAEPLFFDEVKAEPATWSNESRCRTFQRFIGLLPDSPAEVLKKKQHYPWFERRYPAFIFSIGNRAGAVRVIQQVYRRYRRMQHWHEVGEHFLQLARLRLAALRAEEEENISAANFRVLLINGFLANKVSISGGLKTIQLRLVLNPDAGECYLTWKPSRKKKPQINLHDIEKVIAVHKEGNAEAPRLSKKVSHRRGLIIVCKSYHRGRVVLEVSSKQERNLLLRGFQRLLDEMDSSEPTLDDVGAIRKQLPRRKSAIQFFESQSSSTDVNVSEPVSNPPSERGSFVVAVPVSSTDKVLPQDSTSAIAEADAVKTDSVTKSIEHFYQTRFDDAPDTPSHASRSSSKVLEVRN